MTEETLDAEELLHLALKSIEEGRDAETLSLVKRAIALQPENGVLHHPLGAAYAEMSDAGVPAVTIDRMAYYAVFFWARGKEYADGLAALLWTPPPAGSEGGGDADPKGSSRRRTGRPMAKASPTPTDGTPRTARSRKR